MRPRALLLACLLSVVATGAAHGASRDELCAPAILDLALDDARGLILGSEIDLAQALLLEIRACDPAAREARFLLGQVALAQGDHASAIVLYRGMLAEDPDLPRVRLELGRAYFLAHDDAEADHHFRLALAGDLPPAVAANVDAFLEAIRRRRGWSLDLALGLAPDTNINAGPTTRTVTLFGVPFNLADETRQRSGVGLTMALGGQIQQPIEPGLQLRLGARGWIAKYRDRSFDDHTLLLEAGPRFLFEATDLSLLAVGLRRWYGGRGYSRSLGGRIEVNHRPDPRLLVGGILERLEVRYDRATRADGPLSSAYLTSTYALGPSSLVRLLAGVIREETESRPLRNTSWRAAAGYERDLPLGITAHVQPELMLTRYDARQAGFAATRRDRLLRLRLGVSNRRWQWQGFSPVLGYVYARRDSNIELYDYDRHRLEIGVTRAF